MCTLSVKKFLPPLVASLGFSPPRLQQRYSSKSHSFCPFCDHTVRGFQYCFFIWGIRNAYRYIYFSFGFSGTRRTSCVTTTEKKQTSKAGAETILFRIFSSCFPKHSDEEESDSPFPRSCFLENYALCAS